MEVALCPDSENKIQETCESDYFLVPDEISEAEAEKWGWTIRPGFGGQRVIWRTDIESD